MSVDGSHSTHFAHAMKEMPKGNGWRGELPLTIKDVLMVSASPVAGYTPFATDFISSEFTVVDPAPGLSSCAIVFTIPRDYDHVKDAELAVQFTARMSGTTDDVAVSVNTMVARSDAGAIRTGFAPAAVTVATGTTPAVYTIDLSAVEDTAGVKLKPGDTVTMLLVTDGHSTDDLRITGFGGYYRKNPNFTFKTARTSDDGNEQAD